MRTLKRKNFYSAYMTKDEGSNPEMHAKCLKALERRVRRLKGDWRFDYQKEYRIQLDGEYYPHWAHFLTAYRNAENF